MGYWTKRCDGLITVASRRDGCNTPGADRLRRVCEQVDCRRARGPKTHHITANDNTAVTSLFGFEFDRPTPASEVPLFAGALALA